MESKASRRNVRRIERQRRVWELRVRGWTQEEIAREIGVDRATVSRDLQVAFEDVRRQRQEEAAALVDIDLKRCEFAIRKALEAVQGGDTKSISVLVRVLDHRAKLLGLYAPTKTEVSTNAPDSLDDVKARLLAVLNPKLPTLP